MKTKNMKTHTAKRVEKGCYLYRDYTIKSFNQNWLRDPDLKSTYWSVYANNKGVAIDIADTLAEAKTIVDIILSRKSE